MGMREWSLPTRRYSKNPDLLHQDLLQQTHLEDVKSDLAYCYSPFVLRDALRRTLHYSAGPVPVLDSSQWTSVSMVDILKVVSNKAFRNAAEGSHYAWTCLPTASKSTMIHLTLWESSGLLTLQVFVLTTSLWHRLDFYYKELTSYDGIKQGSTPAN